MRFYVQSLANHSVLIGSFLRPAKPIFSNVNHLILISQIDLTLNNENKRFPVLSENEYRTLKHKLRVSALHPKIQAVGTTYGGEVLGYECPLFLKADETGKRIFGKASYAYFNVSTYTSNLISLDLLIYVSPNTVSVCSILPILRVCRRIRYLHAIIKHEIPSENNNLNVSIRELFINENDLPISPKLTSFDISIFTTCDTRSIAYILRCMPNLLHFKFLHESREVAWPSAYDLVNGYTWRHLFEMNVPFLFEFYFSYLNFERISKIRFRHGRKFISIFRSKISRMPKIH
ncbi:unnamed protein product, partial [Rotaria magnacalcarata]